MYLRTADRTNSPVIPPFFPTNIPARLEYMSHDLTIKFEIALGKLPKSEKPRFAKLHTRETCGHTHLLKLPQPAGLKIAYTGL